jgi:hypothetical protein
MQHDASALPAHSTRQTTFPFLDMMQGRRTPQRSYRHLAGRRRLAAPLFTAAIVLVVAGSIGPSMADAPCTRYRVKDGTVLDTKTNLTWEQAESAGSHEWGSKGIAGTAQYYCATLELAGGAWRLPTIKELFTLVDVTRETAIDPNAFPGDPGPTPEEGAYFWSSTPSTNASEPDFAWSLLLSLGGTAYLNTPDTPSKVRCVR